MCKCVNVKDLLNQSSFSVFGLLEEEMYKEGKNCLASFYVKDQLLHLLF